MKLVLVALCVAVASAVEYGALQDVISRAPVRTIRLSEIQAKVESQGPMDQVGSLCYQQMREITAEIDELDSTHHKFRRNCLSTTAQYNTRMNGLSLAIARADKKGADWSVKWNKLSPKLPPYKHKRERALARIVALEKLVVKKTAERAATKKIYDQDMIDFAQALKDIDDLKKILTRGAIGNRQTSGNIAKQGFLEGVDQVQSDRLRQMTNRLSLSAEFLEEEVSEDGPSGIDKIMNLLLKIRNEMWAEMDKLTNQEARSVQAYRVWLDKTRRKINALHLYRARMYITIGRILSLIGRYMINEARERIRSARHTKSVDRVQINKDFLSDSCNAEPPLYQKSRAVKIAEIKTIQQMLKILRNLKWSGAVYNAISRISVSGVDENPEPGYNLGFQMDIHTGLLSNNYGISNRDIKDFGRVAIHLKIGSSWVWASFDAFTASTARYLMPTKSNGLVNQRYVKNLHIFKSPSANVKTSENSAQGNIEMWAGQYGARNSRKIPGASDGLYDFGDNRAANRKFYGSFQVHDYLQKQTLLAVNNFFKKGQHDVGIGNRKVRNRGQHPDWTFARNSGKYQRRKEPVVLTWYFQPKGYDQSLKTKKKF